MRTLVSPASVRLDKQLVDMTGFVTRPVTMGHECHNPNKNDSMCDIQPKTRAVQCSAVQCSAVQCSAARVLLK